MFSVRVLLLDLLQHAFTCAGDLLTSGHPQKSTEQAQV
jgi:hypothetical protein